MQKIRIVVAGALGRMGRKVVDLSRLDNRFQVIAGISRERTTTPSYIPLLTDRHLSRAVKECDVVVDFSTPRAAMEHLKACARFSKAAVVGTTGFSEADLKRIKHLSKRIPIFLSPNMSPAMNLLLTLARTASAALKNFDVHIHESHHRGKKDAPSGTALLLGRMVREGNGRTPMTTSLRAGDIVGDHTLVLAGPYERLELTHRAHSREVFASGALDAALFIHRKKPGLYSFADMMGF